MKLRAMYAMLLAAPLLQGSGSVTVSPVNESVVAGLTRQFTATVSGLANPAVTWSASAGSIDANGLYTAPMSVPANPVVNITAVSMMDPTVSGVAQTIVKTAGPVLTSVAPVSVTVGAYSFTVNGSGFQPGAVVVLNSTAA